MAYPAGEYKEPIVFESPVESLTGSRAPKARWSNPIEVVKAKAMIRGDGSTELFRARQNSPETIAVVLVRRVAVIVTTKMRIRHLGDGRVWDITGVEPQDGKAVQHSSDVWLKCVEGTRAGS